MIPDFETWQRSKPLAPGTKIRLSSIGTVWWNGTETEIVKQDPEHLYLYHTLPLKDGQNKVHRDNFVVIES